VWRNGSVIDRPEGLNRTSKLFLLPNVFFVRLSTTDISRQWWLPIRHVYWTGIAAHHASLYNLKKMLPFFSLLLSPPFSLSTATASGTPATPAPSCNNFIYLLNPATYVSRMINGGAKILAPPHSLQPRQYPFE